MKIVIMFRTKVSSENVGENPKHQLELSLATAMRPIVSAVANMLKQRTLVLELNADFCMMRDAYLFAPSVLACAHSVGQLL